MELLIRKVQLGSDDKQLTKAVGKKKLVKKIKRKPRRIKKRLQRKVEQISEQDTDSCVSLWQSVVVQAFYDIASAAENSEQRLDRAKAIAWFGLGKRQANVTTENDFETVCNLANFDADEIIKLAKNVIRNGNEILAGFNFRTLRRETSSRRPRKNK